MLTPDQIQQIATQRGDTVVPPGTVDRAAELKAAWGDSPEPQQDDPNAGFGDRLKSDFKERQSQMEDATVRGITHKQSTPETVLQQLGVGAGVAQDFLTETGKSLLHTASSNLDHIPGFSAVKDGVHSTLSAILTSPINKAGIDAAKLGMEKYDAWKKENPRAASDIESVVNIASLMPGIKAGSEAVEAAPEVLAGAREGVETLASKAGSAAKAPITAARDFATPIDENVRTVLTSGSDPTALEKKLGQNFETAKAAVSQPGAPTPFDVTGKTHLKTAIKTLETNINEEGKAIATALEQNGHKVVPLHDVAEKFNQGLEDRLGIRVNADGEISSAPNRTSKIVDGSSDHKIVKEVQATLNFVAKNPTLRKVDDAIDKLQGILYKAKTIGAEPLNSETEGLMKEVVGRLNSAAKEIGGPAYTTANQNISRMMTLKNDLIVAAGKNYKNAGAMMKRIFSPQDGGIKDLITRIEDETGQSVFHDATLSKFAMDAVGDARAKSLLELTREGGNTLTSKALHYITGKLGDPKGKALRLIRKPK
jgi:hypothetical protein